MNNNIRYDDLQWNDLRLIQSPDHFCFGTDSVLLANYVEVFDNSFIYDLGSGTGIITILIGGKNPSVTVTGIEIQKDLYDMSLMSIKYNKLSNISFLNLDIKNIDDTFKKGSIVVSNPPYEKLDTGFLPNNVSKRIARYEVKACFSDIVRAAKTLLTNYGKFYFIHKVDRLTEIDSTLVSYGFNLKKLRFIYPNINSEPKLFLACAQLSGKSGVRVEKPMILYDQKGEYTEEIKEIYKPHMTEVSNG